MFSLMDLFCQMAKKIILSGEVENGELHMGVVCNDAADEEGNCLHFKPVLKSGPKGAIFPPPSGSKIWERYAEDFQPYMNVHFKKSWLEYNSDTVEPNFPLCHAYGKEYWTNWAHYNSLPNDEVKAEFALYYGFNPDTEMYCKEL